MNISEYNQYIQAVNALQDSFKMSISLLMPIGDESVRQSEAIKELEKEIEANKTLINNLNEQTKQYQERIKKYEERIGELQAQVIKVQRQREVEYNANKTLINNLNEQIIEIKKSIILSTENANRSGRPTLSDEEIDFIRQLREQGLPQRAVAEKMGIGNGTVAKYDKLFKKKENPKK